MSKQSAESHPYPWRLSSAPAELVSIAGPAGELHGIIHRASTETLVIHIHGMCGNFYHNSFVHSFMDAYAARNISVMFVNTSAHDYVAEAMHDDQPEFVGGSIVPQDRIDSDLLSIVSSAQAIYERVYLQGHSFGCDAIVRSILRKRLAPAGLVLLSPADSRALQEAFTGVPVKTQVARLLANNARRRSDGHAGDIELLVNEAGVVTDDARYVIPITKEALLSFLQAGPGVFRYDAPSEGTVGNDLTRSLDAFAYVGLRDEFFLERQERAVGVLERMFRRLTVAAHRDGNHHFTGLEAAIATEAASWVHQHCKQI